MTPPPAPRPLGSLVFASLVALSSACTPGADGSVVGGRADARADVDGRSDDAPMDAAEHAFLETLKKYQQPVTDVSAARTQAS